MAAAAKTKLPAKARITFRTMSLLIGVIRVAIVEFMKKDPCCFVALLAANRLLRKIVENGGEKGERVEHRAI